VHLGKVILASKGTHGVLQNAIIHGLSTTCRANKHETVTHLDGIVELDNLGDKDINWLHVEVG
jgi:hypothetical protein